MRSIFLLEPEPTTGQQLKAALHEYKTSLAHSVAAAKTECLKEKTNLFLVDLDGLPPQDGDAFLQWLRSQPPLRLIPRLFLSSPATSSLGKKFQADGEEVLFKPLDPQQLFQTIKQLLYQSAIQASHSAEAEEVDQVASIIDRFIGRKIGSLQVEKELGRGAMGAVFQARQTSLNRKVAVKIMLPELLQNESAIQRFFREGQAIASLKNPHIVQVFDANRTDDGIYYLVMEFLEGVTMEDIIEKKGPYSLPDGLRFLRQTCIGLQGAHEAGLTHRDIKPSNLMISPAGHLTITDFGLVRLQQGATKATQLGAILGTPAYLSPEQASSSEPTSRSDIYSLGIVFYEMLTGHLPYQATNMVETLVSHLREPLPDPRKHVPSLPAGIFELLQKMTHKKPDDRFPSCKAILEAIDFFESSPSSPQLRQSPSLASVPYSTPPTGAFLPVPTGATSSVVYPTAPSTSGAIPPQPAVSGGFASPVTPGSGFFPSPSGFAGSGFFTPAPPLDPVSLQKIASLQSYGVSLPPQTAEGIWILSSQGQFTYEHGTWPDGWRQGAFELIEQAWQQSQQWGAVQHIFAISSTHRLLLFPRPEGLGILLFRFEYPFPSTPIGMGQTLVPENRIPETLNSLSVVPGVYGVCAFHPSGHLLDQRVHPSYLQTFLQILQPLRSSMQSLHPALRVTDFVYAQGRLISWRYPHLQLFVYAAPQTSKAQLSSAVWAGLGPLFEPPPAAPASPSSFAPGQLWGATVQNDSGAWASPELTSPSGSMAVSSSSLSAGEAFVPNPLSSDSLDLLQKIFTSFVGPLAETTMKKEAKTLGFSLKRFPSDKWSALLRSLAARINDASKREAFLNQAKEIKLPPARS